MPFSNRQKALIIVFLCLLSAFGGRCSGALVTVSISGWVTSVEDSAGAFGGEIFVGEEITGFYKYDSAALDSNPSNTIGDYKYDTSPFGISLNIGEMLFDMEANPGNYADFFKDRVVIIGNFEEDMHATPVGKMSGPVLLANIYLSLLNRQHEVSLGFFLTLLVVFSGISYVALYKGIPEIKFNFKFLFSSYVVKFIRGYVSYFGCMFLLSILVLIIFNVQVALFLPSFIFTGMEYIRQKKYKKEK